MKSQPNADYVSDDIVMTPYDLAEMLVEHFQPDGRILEPCKGTGNFVKAFKGYGEVLWCEIKEGKDFMQFDEQVDWIITNPPWSKIREFLNKAMRHSTNVCFLFTINHLWTRARINDIKQRKFGIKEIVIFNTPSNFPPLGFQVGMVHLQKYYDGDIKFTDLMYPPSQTLLEDFPDVSEEEMNKEIEVEEDEDVERYNTSND